jgi:glycosyltransferase involved in cell wall biosynthesis
MTNEKKLTYISSNLNEIQTTNVSPPIILTIAVPTYNRESELAFLLENLILRCSGFYSKFEIVISDNCSVDHTWDIINKFNKDHGDEVRIRAFRQGYNQGAHRNITFLMDQAAGDYVWTIADDDLVAEDAIVTILDVLKKTPSNALLLRTEGIGEWDKIKSKGGKPIDRKTVTPEDDDYLNYLAAGSFLASVIFRTTEYVIYKELIARLEATTYPHLILFWHIVSSEKDIYVVESICVQGNANFSGNLAIPSFEILVHGRGVVWSSLMSGCEVKVTLKPYICGLYTQGWLSILAGRSNDVLSLTSKAKALSNTWSILGFSAWKCYFLFLGSVILPFPKLFNLFTKVYVK